MGGPPRAAKAMAEQVRTVTAPRIGPSIGMPPLGYVRKNDETLGLRRECEMRKLDRRLLDAQPVVPGGVQHEPRHQPVSGLVGEALVAKSHVGHPLLVARKWPEHVHVRDSSAGS